MSETLGERPASDVIGKVRVAHQLLCKLPGDRASAAFHRQLGEVERLLDSALTEAEQAKPRFTPEAIEVAKQTILDSLADESHMSDHERNLIAIALDKLQAHLQESSKDGVAT